MIVHTYMCEGKKGRGLLACRAWVVCFVSKMSICLCKVIPYDLPKYTGLGCPSVESPPPPLTPITTSPGLEVLPFYLPLRGYEKADKAFHSLLLLSDFWIRIILKWLQHPYSSLVAPKQLTWQLNNAMVLTENRHSEEFCTSRKDPDSSIHTLTQPGSHPTSPKKSKKPSPNYPGLP